MIYKTAMITHMYIHALAQHILVIGNSFLTNYRYISSTDYSLIHVSNIQTFQNIPHHVSQILCPSCHNTCN